MASFRGNLGSRGSPGEWEANPWNLGCFKNFFQTKKTAKPTAHQPWGWNYLKWFLTFFSHLGFDHFYIIYFHLAFSQLSHQRSEWKPKILKMIRTEVARGPPKADVWQVPSFFLRKEIFWNTLLDTLIQFVGDESLSKPLIHKNSKKNVLPRTTTKPSVLRQEI